jgi:hypothetical protein
MALYVDNTEYKWYEKSIVVDGVTISSPQDVQSVFVGGTKVFGLTNTTWTLLADGGAAPDSAVLETFVSNLINNYSYAIEDYWFQTGDLTPGGDLRWYYKLYRGYRMNTSDGIFYGGEENITLTGDGRTWTGYLWEGNSVTGANTSHNGGTNMDLERDVGV